MQQNAYWNSVAAGQSVVAAAQSQAAALDGVAAAVRGAHLGAPLIAGHGYAPLGHGGLGLAAPYGLGYGHLRAW